MEHLSIAQNFLYYRKRFFRFLKHSSHKEKIVLVSTDHRKALWGTKSGIDKKNILLEPLRLRVMYIIHIILELIVGSLHSVKVLEFSLSTLNPAIDFLPIWLDRNRGFFFFERPSAESVLDDS